MAKKKKVWNHKRQGKGFTGNYDRGTKKRDRAFILSKEIKGKLRVVSYESHEAAKRYGWKAE